MNNILAILAVICSIAPISNLMPIQSSLTAAPPGQALPESPGDETISLGIVDKSESGSDDPKSADETYFRCPQGQIITQIDGHFDKVGLTSMHFKCDGQDGKSVESRVFGNPDIQESSNLPFSLEYQQEGIKTIDTAIAEGYVKRIGYGKTVAGIEGFPLKGWEGINGNPAVGAKFSLSPDGQHVKTLDFKFEPAEDAQNVPKVLE